MISIWASRALKTETELNLPTELQLKLPLLLKTDLMHSIRWTPYRHLPPKILSSPMNTQLEIFNV